MRNYKKEADDKRIENTCFRQPFLGEDLTGGKFGVDIAKGSNLKEKFKEFYELDNEGSLYFPGVEDAVKDFIKRLKESYKRYGTLQEIDKLAGY